MFVQVFIECRRRLHHEESYVKYFRENSSKWMSGQQFINANPARVAELQSDPLIWF